MSRYDPVNEIMMVELKQLHNEFKEEFKEELKEQNEELKEEKEQNEELKEEKEQKEEISASFIYINEAEYGYDEEEHQQREEEQRQEQLQKRYREEEHKYNNQIDDNICRLCKQPEKSTNPLLLPCFYCEEKWKYIHLDCLVLERQVYCIEYRQEHSKELLEDINYRIEGITACLLCNHPHIIEENIVSFSDHLYHKITVFIKVLFRIIFILTGFSLFLFISLLLTYKSNGKDKSVSLSTLWEYFLLNNNFPMHFMVSFMISSIMISLWPFHLIYSALQFDLVDFFTCYNPEIHLRYDLESKYKDYLIRYYYNTIFDPFSKQIKKTNSWIQFLIHFICLLLFLVGYFSGLLMIFMFFISLYHHIYRLNLEFRLKTIYPIIS